MPLRLRSLGLSEDEVDCGGAALFKVGAAVAPSRERL
jgi:hypothetical protein